MYLQKSNLSTFSLYPSATMPLGPLIFGSDGDIVQFLSDKHLSSNHHCPKCFEEMRIDSLLFCLFVCIYQCECKFWGTDSSNGQKSSCEEYAIFSNSLSNRMAKGFDPVPILRTPIKKLVVPKSRTDNNQSCIQCQI